MRTLRFLLSAGMAFALLASMFVSPALARPAYQRPIDITFPVGGHARFSNDYHGARAGHTHRATDLFARSGTPVVAARAGRVVWLPRSEQYGAGWALWIRDRRGVTFAYYHLGPAGGSLRQAIAAGLDEGDSVRRGQVIGRVGDSGNAAGGTPHLHFEMHDPRVSDPWGGDRRNPYRSLLRARDGQPRRSPPAASRSGGRASAGGRSSAGGRTTAANVPTLAYGARGSLVASWQRGLNQVIDAGLGVDGVFGPMTRAATIRFQRSAGLSGPGLGIVGPRSRAAMLARLDGRGSSSTGSARRPVTSLLRIGSAGPQVATWQRQLNRASSAGLTVDGAFGPRTHAATVRFQRSAGLGPGGLGVVGPLTRSAMARRL